MPLRPAIAWLILIGLLLAAPGGGAGADPMPATASGRQSPDDAWWTGPLLAAPAAAMPRGKAVLETYLFDVMVPARYDASGDRHDLPRSDNYVALGYFAFGLTDRLTLGLISSVGYQSPGQGPASSGAEPGDLTAEAQFQVAQWRPGRWLPTISLQLSETFPTGRYDRLGDRPSNGFGAGAHTTTLAINTQRLSWMPNGRLLRCRFSLAYAFSDRVDIRDASVYGTGAGFRGQAMPGDGFEADLGAEYNATRHWVLALDLNYRHSAGTTVLGSYPHPLAGPPVVVADRSAASRLIRLGPAIEYNWNAKVGAIAGVVLPVAGRNTAATITPTVALNVVF
jgi:hypothetical protein